RGSQADRAGQRHPDERARRQRERSVRAAANRSDEREPPHHRCGARRGERGGVDEMKKLTVGFIPLLDCAPIIAAVEQGFAAAEGLDVKLVRETSWANIRD